jgi:hypothetical protein
MRNTNNPKGKCNGEEFSSAIPVLIHIVPKTLETAKSQPQKHQEDSKHGLLYNST